VLIYFIEKKVINGRRRRTASYADKSGTVNGKLDWCNRVLAETHSIEDMSKEAIRVVNEIYKHVELMNK